MTGFPAALAYFALALFWLHTLLIAAAAWGEYARLSPRGRGARPGVVLEGSGPQGQLATHRVRQVGRTRGDGVIHFHDRAHEGALFGGTLALAEGPHALAPGGAVWASRAAQDAAAACPGPAAFADAAPRATRAAGWERDVEVSLGPGDRVWLAEGPEGPLVAAEDPARWRRRALALTAALLVGLPAAAAACTLLCLWPPVFGDMSKLGALAALVAFNLFQLLGKLHRDAIQPPDARALGGVWRAP